MPISKYKALQILEVEGLMPAFLQMCEVLAVHGMNKHGCQKWKTLTDTELHQKAMRHIWEAGADAESGLLSRSHGAVRALMIAQHTINENRARELEEEIFE